MLRILLLTVIFVAVVAFAGYGQVEDQPAPPGEPTVAPIPPKAAGLPHDVPPEHAVASVGDGQLLLLRFSFTSTQQQVMAKIEVDHEVSEEWILRTVPVGSVTSTWMNLTTVRAYEDGQELAAGQLTKKLAKPKHVLIANKKPDDFYMDIIKDGVIVLIMPSLPDSPQFGAMVVPAMGMPGMIPAPVVEEAIQLPEVRPAPRRP